MAPAKPLSTRRVKNPEQIKDSTRRLSTVHGYPVLLSIEYGHRGLLSIGCGHPGLLSIGCGYPGLLSIFNGHPGLLSIGYGYPTLLSIEHGHPGLLSIGYGHPGEAVATLEQVQNFTETHRQSREPWWWINNGAGYVCLT